MIRIVGALLLMTGSGYFAYSLSATSRQEIRMLRHMIGAIQEMEWELKYRLTELPELCDIAAKASGGKIGEIFHELAKKLKRHEAEDISGCLNGIICCRRIPKYTKRNMIQLGRYLGRYDLEGQLQGLELVRRQCRKDLKTLEDNSVQNLHNYQTLVLCAGAAMVILFI